MSSYYGTISEANTYFSERLYTDAWDQASADNRVKALKQATRIIDALNYKGVKAAVYDIMYDSDGVLLSTQPTEDEKITADQSQELEFPRGKDASVPEEIEWSCYEIAFALLEGFNPDTAADELRIIKQSYAAVGTTYAEGDAAMEYLMYGIPNGTVWRWIRPRLVDDRSINLRRVS
jgi:hypothetical protein